MARWGRLAGRGCSCLLLLLLLLSWRSLICCWCCCELLLTGGRPVHAPRWLLPIVCLQHLPPPHPLPQAYVQFFDNNGAAAAKQAISGRLFAGNTVNVQFIGAHAYAGIMQNAV